MRVAFVHPDLGLGGAERLIVDAALELRARGHVVVLFTSGHDPARAFPATVDGRLEVRVHGARIPPRVAGGLQALCTIARVGWLARAVLRDAEPFDIVVCDVVPHALPFLRARGPARTKLVYFCHFPDQLLVARRDGVRRIYRAVVDRLELPAMRTADRVLVNSRFTAGVLARIGYQGADVLYPGIDTDTYAAIGDAPPASKLVLSISRFDPRKNLGLAIEALALVRQRLTPASFAGVKLVLAGGFDPRQREDAATWAALEELTARLELAGHVELLRSPSDRERLRLLSECRCVIYTPEEEHFGLVPVEAMAAGRPVIASHQGGPAETIVDGETGYLREPTPDAFAEALARLLAEPEHATRLGRAGRARAEAFSRRVFGERLETQMAALVD